MLFRHDSAAPAAASLRVVAIFLTSLGTKQIAPPIVLKAYRLALVTG